MMGRAAPHRERARGYVALFTVACLAAVVLAGGAVLNARLHGAWRHATASAQAAQARLAADGALRTALAGLARDGAAWRDGTGAVRVTPNPGGGVLVTVHAIAGPVRIARHAVVTLDDARPAGDRVTAVRWAR